ncbi:MAG TPA: DUF5916 domain-containing protein, partial [Gammaproteobacteria bacterium]|nr:DUF5916 domain-containing protein [Gammaproteobacteria bacterium]
GVLGDEIWAQALVVELDVETNPRENLPAAVRTTAYLVEDGSQLLIAFDARDPEPTAVRAYLRDRDTAYNDDFVGVVLDTFNDARRAFEFFANPLGVQMDLIQDDVNRSEDDSWDAIWQSAGTITEQGFVVEMAIPFSQLRFPRSGEQTWGIDVLRFRPRESRTRLSNNPLDRGRNCYLCQFAKFRGFANAEPGKALEVVPTLTSGRTDKRDPATAALAKGDFDSELGVSVRWGITPDLTANLAVNPDFSQVEADIAQLEENTQFALQYPESRPFFLEGADYFTSLMQAVFTRTVADPDVGAKLTGRSSANTFGVFAAEDAVTNLLFPGPLGSRTDSLDQSNQSFVGRYTRGFGESSTIGALVTRRSGDGYHNDVAGIDGRYRVTDQHSIRFQYLDSDTEYPVNVATEFAQPEGDFGGDALRIDYEFSAREWYASVDHRAIEPGFRADAGFMTRADFEQQNVELSRIWHGAEHNWWNRLQVGGNWSNTQDRTGQLLARNLEGYFSFQGPLQSFLQIGAGSGEQFWEGQIFDTDGVFMFGQLRPRSGLNMTLFARKGEQIDFANARLGDQLRLQPQVDWNVNRHLLLRLRHTSDRLTSKSGPTIFDAELTDLRLTWQFNLRSFLRLTLQRQHIERNLDVYRIQSTDPITSSRASQLLYSYKLNPQTVFFAGYSDNAVEDDVTGNLTKTDRTLFIKLSYAWTP